MLDFTRIKGGLGPLWIGAVIDAFSRKVLAIGCIRGGQDAAFAVRLLRRALRYHDAPTWLVTDKDPVLRSRLVNALLSGTAHAAGTAPSGGGAPSPSSSGSGAA
jgi:transposase-like protein